MGGNDAEEACRTYAELLVMKRRNRTPGQEQKGRPQIITESEHNDGNARALKPESRAKQETSFERRTGEANAGGEHLVAPVNVDPTMAR